MTPYNVKWEVFSTAFIVQRLQLFLIVFQYDYSSLSGELIFLFQAHSLTLISPDIPISFPNLAVFEYRDELDSWKDIL